MMTTIPFEHKMDICRVYVGKRKDFDCKTDQLLHELRDIGGIENLKGLRTFRRYDVQGLSSEEMQRAIVNVFSEPNTDEVYTENLPGMDAEFLAVALLPGQFDQRADSAQKCLQLLTMRTDLMVETADVYAFFGVLNDTDREALSRYLINEVESHAVAIGKPDNLEQIYDAPPDIPLMIGFIDASIEELGNLREKWALAMSVDDLAYCQQYFQQQEKRDPTMTEIRVLDTYWSDHCRHTTFLTAIEGINIESHLLTQPIEETLAMYRQAREDVYGDQKKRPECLMDIALIGMKQLQKMGKLQDLDQSEEINACSICVPIAIKDNDGESREEDWLVMFKNETHNHPTEIEPFGGAATCLGGAIRDPLSGRSYVFQAMRITGSGDPTGSIHDTLPGKLPQRTITVGAAEGFSSYGNQIGLQTGKVQEIYNPGYVAKRMEIGAVVGAAPKRQVIRETPAAGDVVLLIGGRTGRDGCGGATGSSKAHDSQSLISCGAEVQKGNALTERALQRLFRNEEFSKRVKRCNDFGAGGVSVAIGELADGLHIELDNVPKKYEGMDGTELAISESQERMACVVQQCDLQIVLNLAENENLEATVVATVTNEKRLRMEWRGKCIVDISRAFLDTSGVQQRSKAIIKPPIEPAYFERQRFGEGSVREKLLQCMRDLNVCSQRGLVERFDSSIGANAVLSPYGGKFFDTPEDVMAAKIPVLYGDTKSATIMAHGFDPNLSEWSPFHGGVYAVMESLAKIAAGGSNTQEARLTLQEYFQRLEDKPERWGLPISALLGAYRAQIGMGVPAIGGKDSMSGSFGEMHVPPTLVSFALGVTDASNIKSAAFQRSGNSVVYLNIPRNYQYMPDFNAAHDSYELARQWIQSGEVISAKAIGYGGIAEAITKMSFGNRIGFKMNNDVELNLFAPLYGDIIFEMNGKVADTAMKSEHFSIIGQTTAETVLVFDDEKIDISEALEAWDAPLEAVFPTKPEEKDFGKVITFKCSNRTFTQTSGIKIAKPRVVVPVFPGTNCEYDSGSAFEKAGAHVEYCIIRNMSPHHLDYSVIQLTEAIKKTQILMLPGGFSLGDEPDGSAKFIAAFLRNERLADATMDLLNNRDGLILGICNGFQALVKLGLLPYGKICELEPDHPTLTHNAIGRHVARYVQTVVSSTDSPWLSGLKTGDVHTIPVSHGEGRFVANQMHLELMSEHGQIVFQYCDAEGKASMHHSANPNGSDWAIEGICSPDGRILGKMGHSERIGANVGINVQGNMNQKLFESGVAYFQ